MFWVLSGGGGPALLPRPDIFGSGENGFWFDGEDTSYLYQTADTSTPVTTTGQTVGRWEDRSGNGHHITQATSGDRPEWHSDGYVTFSGSECLFMASSAFPVSGWRMFLVMDSDDINGNRDILTIGSSAGDARSNSDGMQVWSQWQIAGPTGRSVYFTNGAGGTGLDVGSPTPLNIYEFDFQPTTQNVYLNGAFNKSRFYSFSSGNNSGDLIIGAGNSGASPNDFWTGRMREAICYVNPSMDAGLRTEVLDYLSEKHSIALA